MTTRPIQQIIPIGYTGVLDLITGAPSPSNICAIAVDVSGMSGSMTPQYRMLTDGIPDYIANYRNAAGTNIPTQASYAAGTPIIADGTFEFPSDAGIIAMNVTVAPTVAVTLTVRLLDGPGMAGASSGGGGAATLAASSVSAGAYVAGALVDGASVVEGSTTDAAVGDATGSMNAHLRQIAKVITAGVEVANDSGNPLPVSGTVTVGTMAALVAGSAIVGKVGGITRVIQPTVTVTASAYAAGNNWGGKLTLTNALGSATPSTGAWALLTLTMHTSSPPVLDCLLFGANPAATFTDKSAFPTLSAADNLLVVARISVASTDWVTIGGSSFATIKVGGLPISATTSGTLYSAFNVTSGTPTPAATTDFTALYTFFTDQ